MVARFVALALALLAGCAGGVPSLKPSDIAPATFRSLAQREMSLRVEDLRTPAPKKSAEIVARVHAAVRGRLTSDGFSVHDGSVNALALTLAQPERSLADFPPEHCVLVRAELRVLRRAVVRSEGSACFSYRHAFGFSVATPTRTYREALNFVLDKLGQQLSAM